MTLVFIPLCAANITQFGILECWSAALVTEFHNETDTISNNELLYFHFHFWRTDLFSEALQAQDKAFELGNNKYIQ